MSQQTPVIHPVERGTKVKYLRPKCKCVGGGYQLKEGYVVRAVAKNGKYVYTINTTNRAIPQLGIVQVL